MGSSAASGRPRTQTRVHLFGHAPQQYLQPPTLRPSDAACAEPEQRGLVERLAALQVHAQPVGAELGRIAPGYRANLVIADDDLNVLDTWIDGQPATTPGEVRPGASARRPAAQP